MDPKESTNSKKKILVVEDEVSLRDALTDKLTLEGFEVLKAANGAEGLDLALKNHPDLLLVDLLMPVMDGMSMLKKLREDEWGKDVHAMILTNLNEDYDINEGIRNKSADI